MTEKKYSKVFWTGKQDRLSTILRWPWSHSDSTAMDGSDSYGSDSYGYFISDEVLTEREVDHLAEDVESETGTVCEDDLECEEVGA